MDLKNTYCFMLGIICGAVLLMVIILANGIPQDAQVTRQLMKPCIDYGYTKAKCREMIYIPQSEGLK